MAPIHAAAQMGRLDCVVWLVGKWMINLHSYLLIFQVEKCHISPMERDNDGATPVHFAAARGNLNSILQTIILLLYIQAMLRCCAGC